MKKLSSALCKLFKRLSEVLPIIEARKFKWETDLLRFFYSTGGGGGGGRVLKYYNKILHSSLVKLLGETTFSTEYTFLLLSYVFMFRWAM